MDLQIGGGDSRDAVDHDCGLEAVGDAGEKPQVVEMESWVRGRARQVQEGDGRVHTLP